MNNSLRDEVKDAIKEILGDRQFMDVDDVTCQIADAVFGVMGIPEDEQDFPLETAKELLGLGRGQVKVFANGWTAEDIHGHREELEFPDWHDEKAERFLSLIEKRLEGLSVSDGNALIEDELQDEMEHGFEYWARGGAR